MTETSAKEISKLLQCNISSIVKWRQKDKVPPLESLVLKEFFWIKLFGDKVTFPKSQVGSDRLAALCKTAVESRVVKPVSKKAA